MSIETLKCERGANNKVSDNECNQIYGLDSTVYYTQNIFVCETLD